jgi:hypothetical protein
MKYFAGVGLAALIAGFAGAASADTVNFNVSRSWNAAGQTYGAVHVTGATQNGAGKINTVGNYVASWSGSAGGLGICNATSTSKCTGSTDESYGKDQHTIDGLNKLDIALLNFGALTVAINSVTFAYWDSEDTFAYGVYSALGAGQMPLSFASGKDTVTNPSVKTFTFGVGKDFAALTGSIFGFGADSSKDDFKLQSISYTVIPKVDPVPLPAAGLMLIAGLGGLAAMKRRKV